MEDDFFTYNDTENKPSFIIKKVHKAIVTATAQQKMKQKALQKMKSAAKKKKARVLLLNKSSVKGFKNLPLNVQKQIMTMV